MSIPMMMAYNNGSYSGAANYQVTTTNVNSITTPSMGIKLVEVPFEAVEIGKYSVLEIANWFLAKKPMSHLKLQKLCYYAQAWNYALKNSGILPLFFFKALGNKVFVVGDEGLGEFDAVFAVEDVELVLSGTELVGFRRFHPMPGVVSAVVADSHGFLFVIDTDIDRVAARAVPNNVEPDFGVEVFRCP